MAARGKEGRGTRTPPPCQGGSLEPRDPIAGGHSLPPELPTGRIRLRVRGGASTPPPCDSKVHAKEHPGASSLSPPGSAATADTRFPRAASRKEGSSVTAIDPRSEPCEELPEGGCSEIALGAVTSPLGLAPDHGVPLVTSGITSTWLGIHRSRFPARLATVACQVYVSCVAAGRDVHGVVCRIVDQKRGNLAFTLGPSVACRYGGDRAKFVTSHAPKQVRHGGSAAVPVGEASLGVCAPAGLDLLDQPIEKRQVRPVRLVVPAALQCLAPHQDGFVAAFLFDGDIVPVPVLAVTTTMELVHHRVGSLGVVVRGQIQPILALDIANHQGLGRPFARGDVSRAPAPSRSRSRASGSSGLTRSPSGSLGPCPRALRTRGHRGPRAICPGAVVFATSRNGTGEGYDGGKDGRPSAAKRVRSHGLRLYQPRFARRDFVSPSRTPRSGRCGQGPRGPGASTRHPLPWSTTRTVGRSRWY